MDTGSNKTGKQNDRQCVLNGIGHIWLDSLLHTFKGSQATLILDTEILVSVRDKSSKISTTDFCFSASFVIKNLPYENTLGYTPQQDGCFVIA